MRKEYIKQVIEKVAEIDDLSKRDNSDDYTYPRAIFFYFCKQSRISLRSASFHIDRTAGVAYSCIKRHYNLYNSCKYYRKLHADCYKELFKAPLIKNKRLTTSKEYRELLKKIKEKGQLDNFISSRMKPFVKMLN